MRFTIFTPAYNRAHTLKRLYESLKRQTLKDFEWLIVNDGSTDNTDELINSFIEEKPFFPINYIRTENGGKHRAINRGMPYAKGKLTFFLDSDDWLLDNALETLDKYEKQMPKNGKYAGLQGWRVHSDGTMIGTTFEGDYVDATRIDRGKHNLNGDKSVVYYTDVIKRYPFPEFEGEKFAVESLVWDEVAHDGYLVRWFNKPIQYCDYLDDGLTHGGYLLYAKNPKQWGLAIYKSSKYGVWSKYLTSIRVYTYYLYMKNTLTIKEMANNMHFSKVKVMFCIAFQGTIDVFRKIFHKGQTLKTTMEK